MSRTRTRPQDARFRGLVMLALAVLGLALGGISGTPLLLAVGGVSLLLAVVFLIASALIRD